MHDQPFWSASYLPSTPNEWEVFETHFTHESVKTLGLDFSFEVYGKTDVGQYIVSQMSDPVVV